MILRPPIARLPVSKIRARCRARLTNRRRDGSIRARRNPGHASTLPDVMNYQTIPVTLPASPIPP
ncbi:hypothetical protein FCJ57_26870 [Burkholderia diffusa]|nr:hypothetical protein [Burkholderia diffusa]